MPPLNLCLKPMVRSLVLLGIMSIGSQAAQADQAETRRIQLLEQKLEESNRLIEALSSRLQALEQTRGAPVAAVSPPQDRAAEPL
jgi:TolA-binding protein